MKENEKKAFDIKNILTEISALLPADTEDTEFLLVKNNSNYAVGATLYQIIGDNKVIGFYRKKTKQNKKQESWQRIKEKIQPLIENSQLLIKQHFT